MAVYKVIQDIEAEDKLLGPFGFRQFIYLGITAVLLFLNYKILTTTGLGDFRYALMFIFLLPMILFGVLASPLGGGQQSTEVWLLARLRYYLKPQRRIWDQAGPRELVTITAPKREPARFSKNLTQNEVRSRLQALAATLDSRGWAVKNVDINLYAQPGYLTGMNAASDRLVSPDAFPQEVPAVNVTPSDDIMDERGNATAAHFAELMQRQVAERREQMQERLERVRSETVNPAAVPEESKYNPNNWFVSHPEATAGQPLPDPEVVGSAPSPAAGPETEEERQLLKKKGSSERHQRKLISSHLKRIDTPAEKRRKAAEEAGQPLTTEAQAQTAHHPPAKTEPAPKARSEQQMTETAAADKMAIAQQMSDMPVSTMIGQVNRKLNDQEDDGEVVISLR